MSRYSPAVQAAGLFGWFVLLFLVAGLGALASVNAGDFYQQLVRPSWAPPGSWFGPVWTVLYVLLAVAAWLVWRVGGFRDAGVALTLFLAQLAFNGLWSWLFFAWQMGALAFANILVLWTLIIATMVACWRVNTLAGVLLIPYLLWVSFALLLNFSVWQLNPVLLG